LPATKVIHVVGPRYREGQDNPALLAQAVGAALKAAKAHGCRTIAMPAISAGIFGYPRPEACRVIVRAIRDWLTADATAFDQVLLVGFDEAATTDFGNALRETDPE
jgi:O-acetyl-ADP-ribose deacetylase (regulator of RNase III)